MTGRPDVPSRCYRSFWLLGRQVRCSGELDFLGRGLRPDGRGAGTSGAPSAFRGKIERLGRGLLSARHHAFGVSYSMNVVMFAMICGACSSCWRAGASRNTVVFRWRIVPVGRFSRLRGPYPAFVREHPVRGNRRLDRVLARATRQAGAPWRRGTHIVEIGAEPGTAFLLGVACCLAPVVKHQLDLGRGGAYRPTTRQTSFMATIPIRPTTKRGSLGRMRVRPSIKPIWLLSPAGRMHKPPSRQAWRYILARPDMFVLRTANRVRAFWGFDYIVSADVRVSRPAAAWLQFSVLPRRPGGTALSCCSSFAECSCRVDQ